MAEFTRASVLAIKEESTEGTPVVPAAAGDFIAQQDGFSIEPAFDAIESAEIKASIGKSKSFTGLEKPQASFSHYLRHSGTEGTAPNFASLLKAAFGSTSANGTQRTTTTSSTTTLVKLGAGGSDFALGKAILLKDGTNGYQIRPVHSVSSNDLTLAFPLVGSPASGLGCGKCVNYSPASTGHPTLSLWEYRGNGGALEAMAGARVSEMSIDFAAGELINATYSLEGTKYYFNPITIGATDTKLDFYDGTTNYVATITAKTYAHPSQLADAIQASMNAQGAPNTYTCVYNHRGASAGKFTFTSTGATFTMKWNTGTNAANTVGDKIGFSTAADSTGALTYTSATVQSWAAGYTPSYDSADPLIAKSNEVMIGDGTSYTSFDASSVNIKIANALSDILSVAAESGVVGKAIQNREVTVSLTGLMVKHDAERFENMADNDTIRFAYNFGTKSGGNWVAGKCGCLYIPSATVTSFKLGDGDGVVTVEMELRAFVQSSSSEDVYLNFL